MYEGPGFDQTVLYLLAGSSGQSFIIEHVYGYIPELKKIQG